MAKPYRKKNPYPTDVLIDRMSDEELLTHMGVPRRFHPFALRIDDPWPTEVEGWLSNLSKIYRPKEITDADLAGMGLIFYGPPKTGKTSMSARLLLHLVKLRIENVDPSGRNWSWFGQCMGRFVDWQIASELFREAVDDEEADREATEVRLSMQPNGDVLKRGDWLVIDDISRERKSDFNVGELHRILRRRHNETFPTILTTNFLPDDWEKKYGEVLASFLDRAFVPVPFGVGDDDE